MERFYCQNSDFSVYLLVQAQTIPQKPIGNSFFLLEVAFIQDNEIFKRVKVFEINFFL